MFICSLTSLSVGFSTSHRGKCFLSEWNLTQSAKWVSNGAEEDMWVPVNVNSHSKTVGTDSVCIITQSSQLLFSDWITRLKSPLLFISIKSCEYNLKSVRCGATSNLLILITVTVPYGFWSGFTLTFLLTHMWNQDVCEHFPHRKLASLYSFSIFRSDSSPPLTRAQHIPPNHTHLSNPTWPPSMGRNVRLITRGFTNTRREENDPQNPLTYQRGAFIPPHEHDIRRRSMRWAAYTWLHNEMAG
jgi:hypothetical protein